MKKPFSSASTAKIIAAEQKKRWGKQHRKIVLLSQGAIELQWVTRSQHITLFSWSETKQKACVSFTGSTIFCFSPATLRQICSPAAPAAATRLAPLQPSSSLTAPCCMAACPCLAQGCCGAASPLFCFRDVERSRNKKQIML